MFYFDMKAEDRAQVDNFRLNAHEEGLNFHLSQKATIILHKICQAGVVADVESFNVEFYVRPYINTLFRKGLIRKAKKGVGFEVSKVGAAVLVVCEAAGLIKEE